MMTNSELLLGRLVEERLNPHADVAAIDRRILDLFEEEWCVVSTDMVGFTQVGERAGVIEMLCRIHELRRLSRPIVDGHSGLFVKTIYDRALLLFRRAPDALRCAIALNRALSQYNQHRPADAHIEVSTGIGFGRMLKVGDTDVHGVEVNHAARLSESVAKAGEILVTEKARAALLHAPGVVFEPAGHDWGFDGWRARY